MVPQLRDWSISLSGGIEGVIKGCAEFPDDKEVRTSTVVAHREKRGELIAITRTGSEYQLIDGRQHHIDQIRKLECRNGSS